ncbi:Uncharacterised protein [BD1-7 clade bacterium]|uniref:Uncharacterized protein n=1 Tax=BD1-7 clade bacterium TaxID=2029982 RepID=A0A5S9Q7W0_9GAMM|nr:Uncharacterised protein [BD1-7 clade bacterium]
MKIRMSEMGIQEWPDIVGIWILADPTHGDCSETFTFEQVNGLLHAGISLLFDDKLSIEENSKAIIREFLEIEFPSNANWAIASMHVEKYNAKVTEDNMGIVPNDFF